MWVGPAPAAVVPMVVVCHLVLCLQLSSLQLWVGPVLAPIVPTVVVGPAFTAIIPVVVVVGGSPPQLLYLWLYPYPSWLYL